MFIAGTLVVGGMQQIGLISVSRFPFPPYRDACLLAIERGQRHGVIFVGESFILVQGVTEMTKPSVFVVGDGIHTDGTAFSFVEDVAVRTGETHITGAQSGHLQFAHAGGLAIEVHIGRLAVDVSFGISPQTIFAYHTGHTCLQGKVGHDATHTRVIGAVFLFGTELQFATQQPRTFLGGIASREEIALSLGITANAVGNDVGTEQFPIGYVVIYLVIALAIGIGCLTPYHR